MESHGFCMFSGDFRGEKQGKRHGFRRFQLVFKGSTWQVEILKRLPPHPSIVQLIDTFEEGDWFMMVLEPLGFTPRCLENPIE